MSYKKIIATIVAMVAALGVCIGGYVYVDTKKSREEQAAQKEAASLRLFQFSSGDVSAIDIQNADGHFNLKLGADGYWQIAETDFAHDFTLNNYYCNVITSKMGSLTAERKIQADDKATYGLDDPVTVTCTAGAETYTLLIGCGSVTKEYYYVALPGDDTIYCVKFEDGEILHGGLIYLRDPYLVPFSETALDHFKLERKGEIAYDLTRGSDGQWVLNAPVTDVVIDSVQVKSILTELVRIQSDSFETFTTDKSELAKYGLDDPAYTFTIGTASETKVLQFPDYDPNDSVLYVYDQESGAVTTMGINYTGFLKGKWSQLLSDKLLRVSYEDAKSLEVSVDDKHFTLTLDHANGVYKLDDVDISATGNSDLLTTFKYLFASVSEMGYEEIVEEPDAPSGAPDEITPDCEFVYTLNDGTTRMLSLVSKDDNTYWAYVDHVCIGQVVRRNALSGNSGVLNFLEKMTDGLADAGIAYEPGEVQTEPESSEAASDDAETTETEYTETDSTDTETTETSADGQSA